MKRLSLYLILAFALPLSADRLQAGPRLVFQVNRESLHYGSIEVRELDPAALITLKKESPDTKRWQNLLSVKTFSETSIDTLPNLAGSYQLIDDGIRFKPSFPPAPGVPMVAHFSSGAGLSLTKIFTLPEAQGAPATTVAAIFPSSDTIPENTLRVYVHFSAPMQRGRAAEQIHLEDEFGQRIEKPFLIGPVGELWDDGMRRLTLLLDPGRIKRGVGPNRGLGPALVKDTQRTLVIGAGMRDANGKPLGKKFRKSFTIVDPVHVAIDPGTWKITSPEAGTRSRLRIKFSRALDHGMLCHSLLVFDAKGNRVAGNVSIGADETEWRFAPSIPWVSSEHHIVIPTHLEDISGNNLRAPLDVPVSASDSPPHLRVYQTRRGRLPFTPVSKLPQS